MSGLGAFLSDPDTWWGQRGILVRGRAHIEISVLASLLAVTIGLPPSVVLGHRRVGAFAVGALANVGRALPTLAVVALVFPFSIRWGLGIGFWPTLVALVVLGLPPVIVNAHAGIVGVDQRVVEAARGLGMRPHEVILGVEIPAALPLVATGLRVATTQIVATAALGALAGHNNLGVFVTTGIASRNTPAIITGAATIAVLVVVTDLGLSQLERRLTPWRRDRSRALAGSGSAVTTGPTPRAEPTEAVRPANPTGSTTG